MLHVKFHPLPLLFLLAFLISASPLSSARTLLALKPGQDSEIVDPSVITSVESMETIDEVMGVEECLQEEDKGECLKRRSVAEAHLDYIYTQHLQP